MTRQKSPKKTLAALLTLSLALTALSFVPEASAICALHREPPVLYGQTCIFAQVGGGNTYVRVDGWYNIGGQHVEIDQTLP